jgi:hypothetical protein
LDPQATFFRDLFTSHHLVDVKPPKVVPTWHNDKLGSESSQNRLDRVFVSTTLLNISTCFLLWVDLPFISNHAPVFLQLDFGIIPIAFPFKFNSDLLKDEHLNNLVKDDWISRQNIPGEGAQTRLVGKLNSLKTKVKKWIAKQKKKEHLLLDNIEEEITRLTNESLELLPHTELNPRLIDLELERKRILKA